MVCLAEPCLELQRCFTRIRRQRIRNLKRKSDLSINLGPQLLCLQACELTASQSGWWLPLCWKGAKLEGELINKPSIGLLMGTDVLESVGLGKLQDVRGVVLLLAALNAIEAILGECVAIFMSKERCPRKLVVAATIVGLGSLVRIIWVVRMGFAQAATASVMIAEEQDEASEPGSTGVTLARSERRMVYKRWLWWSRVGLLVTGVQVVSASYLTYIVVRSASKTVNYLPYYCSGDEYTESVLQILLVVVLVLAWVVTAAQCCVGSDVMAWQSLYQTHGEAWRAHYREIFDYSIREALCCLGRRRYLGPLENDEVDSVAALLGDLVAYRASGASHLEVVAGVALLQEQGQQQQCSDEYPPAPEALLREANIFHPYAVAAYTGLLLDVGRHPLTFPCVWLYRQGILTFWNRNRRPALEGDNWWRGHSAAFLRHARLPPEALRKGRVLQTHRETVYFVIVLHHLRSVVVAIRGTETIEDLLTDGLGRECALSDSDILGLLKGSGIPDRVKQQVADTRPHFGHVGVIEAARELSMQLDNLAEDDDTAMAVNDCPSNGILGGSEASLLGQRQGLLTELLGPGGECEGYSLRFVGHSLGGAIAALTGLRLYRRYPDLHVYAFGVLPCVDAITAAACEGFVTSVIYNDEFSSRLSVAALMRLRAAALRVLAADAKTDSALLTLAKRRLFGERQNSMPNRLDKHSSGQSATGSKGDSSGRTQENPVQDQSQRQRRPEQRKRRRSLYTLKGGVYLCGHACRCVVQMPRHRKATTAVDGIDLPVKRRKNRGIRKQPKSEGMCLEEEQELGCVEGWGRTVVEVSPIAPVGHNLCGVNGDAECEGRKLSGLKDSCEMSCVITAGVENGQVGDQFSGPSVEGTTMSGVAQCGDADTDECGLNAGEEGVDGVGQEDEETVSLVPSSETQICSTEGETEVPVDKGDRHPGGLTDLDLLPNGMPGDVENDLIGYDPGSDLQHMWPAEMFVPGLVIHIIREEEPTTRSPWKSSFSFMWRGEGCKPQHHAVLRDRNSFRDVVVSPAMFVDHMPWRCQHGLNEVLEQLKARPQLSHHSSINSELV